MPGLRFTPGHCEGEILRVAQNDIARALPLRAAEQAERRFRDATAQGARLLSIFLGDLAVGGGAVVGA